LPLSTGTRLGPYEVVAPLGAGGMGEVYRARDDRLNREVAVKVLPADLAHHPERIRRFEQEARAASALNHPAIVTIYDVGETDGVAWVAMELIEGETLQERLAGQPLSIAKSLEFAAAIADGLAAAHQAGVVHRDLKPANVMIANEGFVKILDFGLAKLFGEGSQSTDSDLETQTSPGRLIGTAAYMSPEQAAGKPADARADQFALGLILYELLTGKTAFREETAAETLTAILRTEPEPLAKLRPDTPPPLRWIVERCLMKDAKDRYAATSDLARDLRHLVGHLSDLAPGTATSAPVRVRQRARLPWVLSALLLLIAALALWRPWSADPVEDAVIRRFTMDLPAGSEAAVEFRPALAISPDGQQVVFAAREAGGEQRLFSRDVTDADARPLPGTEGASGPFFSPDGNWIGFFAFGKLKKIPATGGTPVVLADAPNARGATWTHDDQIIYAPSYSKGLHRVSASGGPTEVASVPDPENLEYSHRWPQRLPDQRTIVFLNWRRPDMDRGTISLLDLETGEIRPILEGEFAAYSESGHLVYTRAGHLHAVPFDVERGEVIGSPTALNDVALIDHNTAAAHFSISGEGTMVYVPGSLTTERRLVWVDREGNETEIDAPPRAYVGVRLSPDGRRLATTLEGETRDVWSYDFANSRLTRLSTEGNNLFPVWTPDGERLVVASDRGGSHQLYTISADGTGSPRALTTDVFIPFPGSVSGDGRLLAFNVLRRGDLHSDVWVVPMDGGESPRPFVDTDVDERWARFSPDGRWLAYVSDAAGVDQILVAPVPGPGPHLQISTDGGRDPMWSHDGRSIFFRYANRFYEASFSGGDDPVIGRPQFLFEGRYRRPPGSLPNYDVSADGRFLLIKGGEAAGDLDRFRVVLDWLSDLD
jgi:Tol biopolymer transport system component